MTDALGNVTTFTYDANGNQTDDDGRQRADDDATNTTLNNRRHEDHRSRTARRRSTAYDAGADESRLKTDQAGRTTQFEYDKRGKLTKVTDALSWRHALHLRRVGQSAHADRRQQPHYYVTSTTGWVVVPSGLYRSACRRRYAYDATGNLSSRTDFRGKTTTYAYESMNRLLSKTPDASLGEPAVTYTYTATWSTRDDDRCVGHDRPTPTTRSIGCSAKPTPQGTLTYTYDGRAASGYVALVEDERRQRLTTTTTFSNRLSTVTDNRSPRARHHSYTYDPNGNLTSVTYPNAVQTTYTYNALNRLTNLSGGEVARRSPLTRTHLVRRVIASR